MSDRLTPTTRRSTRASRVCALVTIAIGAVVLLGWTLGVSALTSITPSLLATKANGAICFVLLGLSLWLLLRDDAGRTSKAVAVVFALVGLAYGLVTLIETVAKVDLHIDQALFEEAAGAAWTASPGRPPATASLAFVLVSTGLLALRMRRTTAMQLLAGGAGIIATASLLTFALGASKTRAFGDYYTTIPLLGAVSLLALGIGLLLARPYDGPMAVFASRGAGGKAVRRLAPVMVAIPIGVDVLIEIARREGFFTEEYERVLEIAMIIVLSIVVVWLVARWLDRGEQALRESEQKLGTLLGLLPVGVSVLDEDRNLVYQNPTLGAILDMPAERLAEGAFRRRRYIRPDGSSMLEEEFASQRAIAEQKPVHDVETGIVKENGEVVWVSVSAAPVGLPDWKTVIATVDVTARRRANEALSESEARFATVFMASPTGIALTTLDDGRVVDVNTAAADMLGYAREEVLGQTTLELGVWADDDRRDEMVAALRRDGRVRELEARWRSKSGEIGDFLVWAEVIVLGGEAHVLNQLIDVTERKRAEEQLLVAEAALRRERDELERSNAELEQFAYVASHDLQEPLRMVAMYTQLLAQRYQGRLDDDADEFIGYAVDGAKRMQALITDLLEFSRLGTRESKVALTDSGGAFDEAVANLSHAIGDGGAEVTRDDLPTVTGDHQQLVRVFQNLIGNAVKFHGEEPPRVHVSAAQENGEWVFSVRDNGIGMDPQHFDRIFLIFQRLHPKQDYPGTGIGLSLCQRIVARHGGRMWVQSAPGEGSTFFFTIPVGDEPTR